MPAEAAVCPEDLSSVLGFETDKRSKRFQQFIASCLEYFAERDRS